MKLLPLLLLAIGAYIKVPFQPTIEAYNYVQRIGGESREAPGSPSGEEWIDNDQIVLEYDTWTIPNCPETGFMLDVRFDNIPEDVTYLDLEVTFPRMSLPHGGNRERISRREPLDVFEGTAYFYYGYYFDHEYERGLGDWTFTLRHKGKEVFKAAFTVVDCEHDH